MFPLHPLLLARPLDNVRQIAHGQVEREVQTGKHDGEKDPPPSHGGYE